MEKNILTLDQIPVNAHGVIMGMNTDNIFKKKLTNMGLVEGTEFKVNGRAPLGDPIEISLRGYKLAIRKNDAKKIMVKKI
ncbi:MAG: ferrous iron transport protein A [Peptococcaceae bacterium]|nr:ferrous iron transport protein A [Peptococcaceae bacterium]